MPLPHKNTTAERVLAPRRYIYILEAPTGVWSSGPMVVESLDYCEGLLRAQVGALG